MKLVYVIHPYRENRASNKGRVRAICATIQERGDVPVFAPFCFPWLDDEDENDRRLGKSLGLALLDRSDVAEAHGSPGAYSEGRDEEILHARERGIPVTFVDEPEAT